MSTIQEMNEAWPARLTGLNAQLWENLKGHGVLAYWVGPSGDDVRGAHFEWAGDDVHTSRESFERPEFRVELNGEELACFEFDGLPRFETVTIMALNEAAEKLEGRGLRIRP